jgi:hypothetical protein
MIGTWQQGGRGGRSHHIESRLKVVKAPKYIKGCCKQAGKGFKGTAAHQKLALAV